MMAVMVEETRDQLSRLVRERRAELGMSLAQVAEASGDPDLNASWINRLELGRLRESPKRERLASLAQGLRLGFQLVARAAGAQFMGIEDDAEWSSDGSVRAVVARMAELSEEGRRDLADLAEIFARGRRDT
jgi:transcriptional regulator with XRE-family HTH domain